MEGTKRRRGMREKRDCGKMEEERKKQRNKEE